MRVRSAALFGAGAATTSHPDDGSTHRRRVPALVSPGVAFAAVVSALGVGGAVVLLGYWWFRRSGAREATGADSPEAWYAEAATLVREVQQLEETAGEVVERDRVQRQILPLSARIKGHARAAPRGVDERVVADLHDLGVECYRVGMEHTRREAIRTGDFLSDRLAALASTAAEIEATLEAQYGDEQNSTSSESEP